MGDLTGSTTELLQQLIRNQCVNDGRPESGEERRSADTLLAVLEGAGLDIEIEEPTPGRGSVIARIEGSDPGAPSLCLMGHTDVVPVSPSQWQRDPFGGELVDGEVWGRGAIDMLNLTSAMAVAVRSLADEGFRPRGDLIYVGVADEEAGGAHGAGWLCDHAWDAVGADAVITESGGLVMDGPTGRRVSIAVGEKGAAWRTLRIKGTPGHGSQPWGVDNALVKTAEVVRRLADYRPMPVISELWRARVEAADWDDDLKAALLDPARLDDALVQMDLGAAKLAHACTHTTFSPNVVHGGVKTNVIPDQIDLEVDIRTLPGETADDVEAHLRAALGDLANQVEIRGLAWASEATASSIDTDLYRVIGEVVDDVHPGATLLPGLIVGGTDARFYRAKGAAAYGFALFSPDVKPTDIAFRFHGVDERIDVESLRYTTEAIIGICRRFLG